ncbi:MAG: Flp family type IVb pilin [Bacillota bacterium]
MSFVRSFTQVQIRRLVKEQTGATMIEYGLIAALIAVALIAVLTSLGGAIGERFQDLINAITGK